MNTIEIEVDGIIYDGVRGKMKKTQLTVLITNDEHGKTLSINDGCIQFTVPAEKIAEYLK